MNEVGGELFSLSGDVVCITTNGFVSTKGKAVMGRGCALQAKQLSPGLDRLLGEKIKAEGNVVNVLLSPIPDQTWLSFPVKPESVIFDGTNSVKHALSKYKLGEVVPGYHAKADLAIIEQSAEQLRALADTMPDWQTILLPRPGCGAGELDYAEVKPILEKYLDDRFHVVTFPEIESDFKELIYAGIGARDTPPEMQTAMRKIARSLSRMGFTLRSGGAGDADQAFEQGSAQSEIFLPWYRFNGHPSPNHHPSEQAKQLASEVHVNWESLENSVKNLHARNAEIIYGIDLNTPVDFVVCWTKDAKDIGGTGLAIRLAKKRNIPVFNLANGETETINEIADYLYTNVRKTTVVNVHYQDYDVYIGRAHHKHSAVDSIWHNPFHKEQESDRDHVISQYEAHIRAKLTSGEISLSELLKLRGKRLGCFCKPRACHGDVLVKILGELNVKI